MGQKDAFPYFVPLLSLLLAFPIFKVFENGRGLPFIVSIICLDASSILFSKTAKTIFSGSVGLKSLQSCFNVTIAPFGNLQFANVQLQLLPTIKM